MYIYIYIHVNTIRNLIVTAYRNSMHVLWVMILIMNVRKCYFSIEDI